MELLPVASGAAGDPVGPGAAGMPAGDMAANSPSRHPAGLLAHHRAGDSGAQAAAGLPQGEEDGGQGSATFVKRVFSPLEDNFSVVWLSAVQMTEGLPAEASPAWTLLSFADSIVGSDVAPESAPADPASLAAAQQQQGTATAVKQTILPAFPLLTLAQPAAVALKGGQTTPNTPIDVTPQISAANVETQEGKSDADTPAGIHGEPRTKGPSQAASDPGSGLAAVEPADAKTVPSEQVHEGDEGTKTPHRDNGDGFFQNKDLKVRQRESNESAGNEHDRIQPVRVGNASPDRRTPELQETPAAEGVIQDEPPATQALTKEGPKPQEVLTPAENPWNRAAAAASTAALVSPARGTRGVSRTGGDSDTPRGASVASLMRGLANLSEAAKQQPSSAGKTAFEAEIHPKTIEAGQKLAVSDADAAEPARQGHPATPANVSFRNLSAAIQARETEAVSESPLSQPRSLPAKTADSYVSNLPGSPQPSITSAAPRPSAPAAPLLTTEFHTAEFETRFTKPAGDVTVQLRTEEHGTANIRFREQAGQVQVTVRTGDPQLVHSLRAGLDHLKNGLDLQGFQTTVFNSSSTAALRRGEAESSSDTYHRAHEDPSAHEREPRDHSGRGNQQAEDWMEIE